jgi:hypothetical protein
MRGLHAWCTASEGGQQAGGAPGGNGTAFAGPLLHGARGAEAGLLLSFSAWLAASACAPAWGLPLAAAAPGGAALPALAAAWLALLAVQGEALRQRREAEAARLPLPPVYVT